MTKMEWINLLGLFAAVAAGSAYVGHLSGRLDAINPEGAVERIESARDAALEEVGRANDSLSDLGNLHSDTFEWRQGRSAVQMIRVSEGICYLVYVTGRFEGGGETVSIYASGDYWFLGGSSRQAGIGARARCWRFPTFGADQDE